MYCLPCLLVLYVYTKTHSVKQVPVTGTKQSRWADQAGRLTWQSGLPNLFLACLLCFVPVNSALVLLKWMFHKLRCVEQCTFLRYLWLTHVYHIIYYYATELYNIIGPIRVCSHTRCGSSNFTEQCDFNTDSPIFSNRHCWRQQQHVMFSRLCKHHFRLVNTMAEIALR